MKRTLVTGGSGLLGTALRRLEWPGAQFPGHDELDISNRDAVREFISAREPHAVLHAAAFTSPPRVDDDPARALRSNIEGTCFVTEACIEIGARLVYVSTDYVFAGDKGDYAESDSLYPVNGYAWSKLGGECAVRLHKDSLIIRTSFGADVFPYSKAFVDQITSREPVSVTAAKIKELVQSDLTGVIHIGAPGRTVYEYAKSLGAKDVGTMSINDVSFAVPMNTSLDTKRYEAWIASSDRGRA